MYLHELKPAPGARKRRKRVGRGPGSGHGKTCGRGQKGQKARSGAPPPWFEGGQTPLHRRLPKKGFFHPKKVEYEIVNVKDLNRFEDDTVVTPELLESEGLVKDIDKKLVKILGDGELTKRLIVRAHKFSKSALQKIEAAGGKAEVI
ncbi:50S ribosomal protein L15 [Candidatus Poribacteria bacterium]|nr:MAG: 50S ribosomal protein L15 [Candidatus Poribacteria bacterium]